MVFHLKPWLNQGYKSIRKESISYRVIRFKRIYKFFRGICVRVISTETLQFDYVFFSLYNSFCFKKKNFTFSIKKKFFKFSSLESSPEKNNEIQRRKNKKQSTTNKYTIVQRTININERLILS